MKTLALACFLTLVAAPALAGVDAAPSIPREFPFRFGGGYAWVAATHAVQPNGRVREDVLKPSHRKRMDIQQRRQAELRAQNRGVNATATRTSDGCDVSFYGRQVSNPAHHAVQSLQDLVKAASTRQTFVGRVTATEAGFHSGVPHTVVQVRLNSDARVVYLLYPKARLDVEGKTVCNDDPTFAPVPKTGSAITFVAGDPIDESLSLYSTDGTWIFYEEAGRIVASPGLQTDTTLASLTCVEALAALLRGEVPASRETTRTP